MHPDDSVLGQYSRGLQKGLTTLSYQQMITEAFRPEWWQSTQLIQIDKANGNTRKVVLLADLSNTTEEYTQLEYNWSLFFGLAVQLYESTLVSNNAPIDQYFDGNHNALTAQQIRGKELFEGNAKCINCHGGAEFTNASVKNVQNERLERMVMGDGQQAVYDNGFYNIGVRPTTNDLGVGGNA